VKKILIVTYHFPPVNNIAARRFGEMAPYMREFGWEPFILTTHSEGDLPVGIPEGHIIRVGKNYSSGKLRTSEEGYRGIPRLMKPLYFLYKKLGITITSVDRFTFGWYRDALKHMSRIEDINPDIIIATHAPVADLRLGRRIAKKLHKPWVADFRDACSLINDSRFPFATVFDKMLDKRIVKSASLVTTISPTLARVFETFYKKPVALIFNGFDETGREARGALPGGKKEKILYYAGRFHAHRLGATFLLIDWLAGHPHAKLTLRSLGPSEANDRILAYAKKKHAGDRVLIKEPASPDVIRNEEESADVLVLFEDIASVRPFSQTNVTGKLFEYLPFRAPILAIARKDSDIGYVLGDTGRGQLVSSAKELNSALSQLLAKQPEVPDYAKIARYSRKAQCEILCKALDKLAVDSP